MDPGRFVRLTVFFVFVLEVLNPSTIFVREHVGPSHKQKQQKVEKAPVTAQVDHSDQEAPSPSQEDEDLITGSAVIPIAPLNSRPDSFVLSPPLDIQGAPLDLLRSIHRPPSIA